MARRRCTFTQDDITRALKAAAAAGVDVRLEIEPSGKIVLVPNVANPVEPEAQPSIPADQIVL
jgi:hypothetical protein